MRKAIAIAMLLGGCVQDGEIVTYSLIDETALCGLPLVPDVIDVQFGPSGDVRRVYYYPQGEWFSDCQDAEVGRDWYRDRCLEPSPAVLQLWVEPGGEYVQLSATDWRAGCIVSGRYERGE